MKSICLLLGLFLGLMQAAWAQPAPADKNALYAYEGTYELEPGHRITLGIFDEFKSLVYLDLKTRQLGALKPIKQDVFSDNTDSTKHFTFRRDDKGGISGVAITNNKLAVIGKRVAPHVRQAVAFTSGPHTLKGDLYLPATKGPHPAVVFAHGSGASTRSVAFFTTYFLQLGIAVLSFDKQGAGESAGDWQTASFDELTDDVLAGIGYLKTNKSIDQQRIGIMGNSQGGWIGAMAAAKSKDVAFLVVRVGAGENVMQTMLHENRGINLADGFKEKDVQEMLEMDTRYMTAAR